MLCLRLFLFAIVIITYGCKTKKVRHLDDGSGNIKNSKNEVSNNSESGDIPRESYLQLVGVDELPPPDFQIKSQSIYGFTGVFVEIKRDEDDLYKEDYFEIEICRGEDCKNFKRASSFLTAKISTGTLSVKVRRCVNKDKAKGDLCGEWAKKESVAGDLGNSKSRNYFIELEDLESQRLELALNLVSYTDKSIRMLKSLENKNGSLRPSEKNFLNLLLNVQGARPGVISFLSSESFFNDMESEWSSLIDSKDSSTSLNLAEESDNDESDDNKNKNEEKESEEGKKRIFTDNTAKLATVITVGGIGAGVSLYSLIYNYQQDNKLGVLKDRISAFQTEFETLEGWAREIRAGTREDIVTEVNKKLIEKNATPDGHPKRDFYDFYERLKNNTIKTDISDQVKFMGNDSIVSDARKSIDNLKTESSLIVDAKGKKTYRLGVVAGISALVAVVTGNIFALTSNESTSIISNYLNYIEKYRMQIISIEKNQQRIFVELNKFNNN